jgi:hypothetical protein
MPIFSQKNFFPRWGEFSNLGRVFTMGNLTIREVAHNLWFPFLIRKKIILIDVGFDYIWGRFLHKISTQTVPTHRPGDPKFPRVAKTNCVSRGH